MSGLSNKECSHSMVENLCGLCIRDATIAKLEAELNVLRPVHESAVKHQQQQAAKLKFLQAEVARLKAENELLAKDCAFYRCCALSGEAPTDGSEPSKQAYSAGE